MVIIGVRAQDRRVSVIAAKISIVHEKSGEEACLPMANLNMRCSSSRPRN